jgi:hypothetical protein
LEVIRQLLLPSSDGGKLLEEFTHLGLHLDRAGILPGMLNSLLRPAITAVKTRTSSGNACSLGLALLTDVD